MHAPRFADDFVLEQARALTTGAPFDGAGDAPLWADAQTKIDALVTAGKIDAVAADQLRGATRAALLDKFKPAYDALSAWVAADRPHADEVATGVWKLPEGAAFYAERLAAETTTDMTADEIHELGLREVERIKGEMDAIRQHVTSRGASANSSTSCATIRASISRIRRRPQTRISTRRAPTSRPSSSCCRGSSAYCRRRISSSSASRRSREQPGAAQFYEQGTPDGSPAGRLLRAPDRHDCDAETGASSRSRTTRASRAITYRSRSRKSSRACRRFARKPSTGRTPKAGPSTPSCSPRRWAATKILIPTFGRLDGELWRAIRLVVDTGLHAKGWTEEQAVAYFTANSPTSESQIRSEIRRYIVLPGQATSYKIGMLKILELRARARAALGPRFDIRAYHDAVLGGGALPLSILERRVDDWIAASTTPASN